MTHMLARKIFVIWWPSTTTSLEIAKELKKNQLFIGVNTIQNINVSKRISYLYVEIYSKH